MSTYAAGPFSSPTTIEPAETGNLFARLTLFGGSDAFSKAYGVVTTQLFYLVGAALFIYLIWAGISYISAGSDTKKATDARQSVINAVIGIFLFISLYTILSIAVSIGGTAAGLETAPTKF
jgi:hypothetical protein